jgi:hypothetical protein
MIVEGSEDFNDEVEPRLNFDLVLLHRVAVACLPLWSGWLYQPEY